MSGLPGSGVGPYFQQLQQKLLASLGMAEALNHPGAKGDEAEANWERFLRDLLPGRYQVVPKCKFVDYEGNISQEMDLGLCDRQYSTMVLRTEARCIVPAEAAYAVFEVKPSITRENVLYAANKAASIRRLTRTNASIVDARGRIENPREPSPILAGLLATRSGWRDGLGDPFKTALRDQDVEGRLNLGCVLMHAGWEASYVGDQAGFDASVADQSLVYFYLRLLAALQQVGTVPAMDFGIWSDRLENR